jgi:hypothetical protein
MQGMLNINAKHMEYDGMNGGVVNLGGRHQWHQRMWPMSKYNKGGNLVMLEASQPLQLMIVYEKNMLIGDKLILPLLWKDNHMRNTKHGDVKVGALLWTLMGEK